MDGLRRCSRCKMVKALEEFSRDKTKVSGRNVWCRVCDNARSRRYYEANRDIVVARVVAYQAARRGSASRPPRMCERCGNPATSQRHHLCDVCRVITGEARRNRKRERDKTRKRSFGTNKERGYGPGHQKLRAEWKVYVTAGAVNCARCGEPIIPGTPWDLGHDDFDRNKYSGPEHRHCNRATERHGVKRGKRNSRKW